MQKGDFLIRLRGTKIICKRLLGNSKYVCSIDGDLDSRFFVQCDRHHDHRRTIFTSIAHELNKWSNMGKTVAETLNGVSL